MNCWSLKRLAQVTVLAGALLPLGAGAADEDPYLTYVRNAPEFKSVKQDSNRWLERWDTWVYMPWRYQWGIGTGDEGGQFCKDYGFNGAFIDHGETSVLPWVNKWNLKFYNDHTAGKGWLHLGSQGKEMDFKPFLRDPRMIRKGAKGAAPLDAAMLDKLTKMTTERVNGLKSSPMRAAYALDDEISSGSFVKPLSWRLNDDDAAYEKWLDTYYGGSNHPKAQYVSPDFLAPQYKLSLSGLDFSPLLDRMTYNDGVWVNFLGALVDASNAADPTTPCGFVGGQSPNLWGGYDYAKLCKKVQFIEAYLGTAQSLIRSFNPEIVQVTTHFHNNKLGTINDFWQMWWCLAHGNRGMIGWVEGWFDGKTPKPWLEEWKSQQKDLCTVVGPKTAGGKWQHDGVAVYYSHASVQTSWCLDIEAHGKTWPNRGSDDLMGTWHNVRKAWENMLTDSGIQYNWVSYDQVVLNGVPSEYKVLILPSCYALSDIEAKRIKEFAEKGGTVIADFACGIFDQHGKGRSKGALDDLFGVKHDGTETKADFFAGKLWVETNQDAGFGGPIKRLINTQQPKLEGEFAIAENKLKTNNVKKVGSGTAVYLNLSPMRYLMYRGDNAATDAQRLVFMKPVYDAGVKPRVKVTGPDGKRPELCEITYMTKNNRTYMFLVKNVTVTSTALGDTKTEGLVKGAMPVTFEFPAAVKDVVDERTGQKLTGTTKFQVNFNIGEAAVISFAGTGK